MVGMNAGETVAKGRGEEGSSLWSLLGDAHLGPPVGFGGGWEGGELATPPREGGGIRETTLRFSRGTPYTKWGGLTGKLKVIVGPLFGKGIWGVSVQEGEKRRIGGAGNTISDENDRDLKTVVIFHLGKRGGGGVDFHYPDEGEENTGKKKVELTKQQSGKSPTDSQFARGW